MKTLRSQNERVAPVTIYASSVFLEGPRWRGDRLAVIAPRGQQAFLFDEQGALLATREVPTPNGTAWIDDRRFLMASMTERVIYVWDTESDELEHYADLRDHSPGTLSDMTLADDGNLYVGAHAADALNTAKSEMDVPSRLIRVTPNGEVVVEAETLRWPNGIVITGDGSTLLVAETFASRISAFDRSPDGSLGERRTWYTFDPLPAEEQGPGPWGSFHAPDGLSIDAEDGVWAADASGHGITRIDSSGVVTDFIDTKPLAVFASALGGEDGHTMFMTAATQHGRDDIPGGKEPQLMKVRVDVPAPGY